MAEALLPFCQAIKKLKGPSAGRWCWQTAAFEQGLPNNHRDTVAFPFRWSCWPSLSGTRDLTRELACRRLATRSAARVWWLAADRALNHTRWRKAHEQVSSEKFRERFSPLEPSSLVAELNLSGTCISFSTFFPIASSFLATFGS